MSKIIGNTVGTTMMRPNWEETDERSSAYIGNKPTADDGNFLVGNGKGSLKEMTPEEVLSHINGASVTTMTTAEYEALSEDEFNANTLYVLTDGEEVSIEDIPNLYVWKKYDGNPSGYTEKETSSAAIGHVTMGSASVSYSSEINIADGKFSTDGFESVASSDVSAFDVVKGNYVKHLDYGTMTNVFYYIPVDATITKNDNTIVASPAIELIINSSNALGYVSSKSFSAYPTSGEHTDGYWYEYYRQLGDAAVVDGSSASFTETDPTVPAWAKAAEKPTYTASEVGARPDTWMPTAEDVGALPVDTVIPEVPTKVSAFTNDAGYLTEHQSLDGYAKTADLGDLAKKDSLTASEVGADASGTASNLVSAHNTATDSHVDIRESLNNKLNSSELSSAIDTALAQAKENGEFDGKDGKSAYQYAKDGGYTGTEAEFAAKLASEVSNPLQGKKVSFLGDSICAGSSENSSYGEIIANRNGMIYENVAHAGATVTAETYSRSTGNAKPWLCRMVENMSADADYAIIEGGINDGWDETVKAKIGSITKGYDAELDDTTYYGAFESMLKQLVTKFQGKKIGYIAVPKIHSLYDSSQNAPNFYHIALECCAKWGVSVCDLNTITPPVEYLATLGTEYTADACHPTYEGYLKYYCDPIETWMKTLTTAASVSIGGSSIASDEVVLKKDVQIKKAKLTLEDGTTVLIDVVVASAGTTINKYLNLVPTSIDTDGSIYNGVGYMPDTRLSSSGAAKSQGICVTTGFIPASGGDVIRLGGNTPWYVDVCNNNYLCAYDENFNFIGAVYNSIANSNGSSFYYTKNIVANFELGDVCTITLIDDANIAYIRASWPSYSTNAPKGEDLIVTVNQEITD